MLCQLWASKAPVPPEVQGRSTLVSVSLFLPRVPRSAKHNPIVSAELNEQLYTLSVQSARRNLAVVLPCSLGLAMSHDKYRPAPGRQGDGKEPSLDTLVSRNMLKQLQRDPPPALRASNEVCMDLADNWHAFMPCMLP